VEPKIIDTGQSGKEPAISTAI